MVTVKMFDIMHMFLYLLKYTINNKNDLYEK